MPPKAKGAKKKNGYQMPEKFAEGFSLRDIHKGTWTLGKPIGQGGFGLIYLAYKNESKSGDASYVVKIEPKDNGPLFCETHFYINCAKEDSLKAFMKTKGLKHLALPRYISSGLCTYNDKEYRFLVMDRYVKDVQSVLNEPQAHHRLNEMTVLFLMRQIMYSLEYIHQRGYAHGDIKGANLMLKNDHEAYLLDFGLAQRFERDNVHQPYALKPERRHNGTIEYTSRDAHNGALTNRRSDLEILGYCAVHWLAGTLPWITLITNNEQVQQSKIKYMGNVKEFIKVTLGSVTNISDCVRSFMEYYLNEVNKLEHNSEPGYAKIQTKIVDTLRLLGHSANAPDNFGIFAPKKHSKTVTSAASAMTATAEVEEDDVTEPKNRRKRQFLKSDKFYEEIDDQEADEAIKSTKVKSKTTKKQTTPAIADESPALIFKEKKPTQASKKSRVDELNAQSPAVVVKKTPTRKKTTIHYEESDDNDDKDDSIAELKSNKHTNGTPIRRTNGRTNSNGSSCATNKKSEDSDDESTRPKTNGHAHAQQTQTPTTSKYALRERLSPSSQTPNGQRQKHASNGNGHVIEEESRKNMNIAQLDVITKLKQKNTNGQVANGSERSPLALNNNQEKFFLKKRKNVIKVTISTQTDKSSLN